MPNDGDFTHLTPAIVYKGVKITPDQETVQNFTKTVNYTVYAEDGSSINYKVFVSSNAVLYTYSKDGYVYALDAGSGGLIWKFNTSAAGFCYPPTYYNGLVYVSTGGTLYALDAGSGSKVWEVNRTGEMLPVIYKSMVYGAPYSEGVGDNLLAGYDAATGVRKWKAQVNELLYGGMPLVAEDKVYIGTVGGGYNCFNAFTGQSLPTLDLGIIKANPAYANGSIYACGEWAYLFAFNAANGKQQWRTPFIKALPSTSPTISSDTMFFTSYDSLYAYNTVTQQQLWVHSISYPFASVGNPFFYRGVLYAGSAVNYIYALDAATGTEKWKTGNFVYGVNSPSPVVANGTLYAGSADNYFCAYDAATGNIKWQFPMQGYAPGGACVVDVQGKIFHPVESGEQN